MTAWIRVVAVGVVSLISVFGQCLEPEVKDQVVNALRWNAFWLGEPQASPISEHGLFIKSQSRAAVLVAPLGFWIMFLPSAAEPSRRLLIRKSSGELEREEAEYQRYLAGVKSSGEQHERIIERCRFVLKDIRIEPPDSQRVVQADPLYVRAAMKFVVDQLRYAQCPCRYWIPYFDSTDPMGFALVQDRNSDRYFLGFYWDGVIRKFVGAPTPAETPPYRQRDALTQRLERQILKTSITAGSYPP